jgi:probable O-glycosylation ligase (exosortase A-associated)
VTICIVQSRERIQQLVWVIALSIGFYGIKGGIFSILTGGNYRIFGPEGTFIGDNNTLALALIVTLPLFQYLRTTTANWWVKLGLTTCIGLLILSILSSYSRGALLGIGVTLPFMLVKAKRRLIPLVIGGGAFAAGLLMAPAAWYERMDTLNDVNQDASVQGRFDAWQFAYRVALDHPLFGGGQHVGDDEALFMHYVPTAEGARAAHSIYFEILGEDGFVGLGLFLILMASAFLTAFRIIRLTRDRPDLAWARSLAAMIQVSFVGYAVTGAFLSLGFFDLYYALIAVVASTEVVVKRALKEPAVNAPDLTSEGKRRIGRAEPAYAPGAARALTTASAAVGPPARPAAF